MAFTVQDNTGTVANANAYITVAEFKAYHDDRGNDYSALTPDSVIEKRIVKATDHIDYSHQYFGEKLVLATQTTEFPRSNLYDVDGNLIKGIPQAIKDACAEYALRTDLVVDAPAVAGGAGIKRERVKLDVLETETEYAGSSAIPVRTQAIIPAADRIISRSGFAVRTGGRVGRA